MMVDSIQLWQANHTDGRCGTDHISLPISLPLSYQSTHIIVIIISVYPYHRHYHISLSISSLEEVAYVKLMAEKAVNRHSGHLVAVFPSSPSHPADTAS